MGEAPRNLEFKQFNGVRELLDWLDNEISNTKAVLGDLLRIVEEDKAKAEIVTRLESLLSEISGSKPAGLREAQLELGGVKVYINPTPKLELDLLIDVLRSIQQKVVQLERVKKSLEPLAKIDVGGIKVSVISENGVPRHVLIKIP